jgi:leader peptidase (prepilin peptidase) / N-methyltransferase
MVGGILNTIMIETIALMPPYFVVAVVFVFGLIIGSFLNVYIYRFHTGKSLSGSSHCLSCREPLRFYELFPLFSYLGLRGRCRSCSALIPSRYFWVELTTGVLFVLVVALFTDVYLWPVLLVIMATLVVISVYDLAHFIIPNAFVIFLSILAVMYVGYEVFVTRDYTSVIWNVLAALLAFLFFAGLWWYSDGRWLGFGDAKLAIPLAFMVGIGGVFSMIALSFWIGAIISVTILLWQKYGNRGQLGFRQAYRTLTIKSEVPFAPFLILGFLAVFMLEINVLLWFSYAL